MEGETSSLKKLQNEIKQELKQLPIHPERKEFHPHLTIGRIKSSEDKKIWPQILKEFEKIDFGSFLAQEIVLFKSTLTSQGAEYTRLETFKLGK